MRVLLILLLCAAPLSAQDLSTARYRLIRYAEPATELWWENQRFQDIQFEDVICNLPPADVYTVPGFRIQDTEHAGKECQWTAPAGAEIFLTMRNDRANCFTLRQRPDEWTPWSDSAELCVGTDTPGRPTGVRIVTPEGLR